MERFRSILPGCLALGLLYGLFRAAAPHVQSTLGAALCSAPLTFLSLAECTAAVCLGAGDITKWAAGLADAIAARRKA